MEEYKPEIVVFNCRSNKRIGACAGDVRLIEKECIGCIEPQSLLFELKKGADGVLILGCSPESCQSREENRKAICRFVLMQKMLSDLDISKARMHFELINELKEETFTKIVEGMR